MEEFISYLKNISQLSEKSAIEFLSKCKAFHFSIGHYLVKSGQVCQYLYFVKSGIGKVYYLKEGKELIDWNKRDGLLHNSKTRFLSHNLKF